MTAETERVDPYRFVGFGTRRMIKAWIDREPRRELPWTPLEKSLARSKVALISSAGLRLATDEPFDQEGERRNPWWGDPSFRVIPKTATEKDVRADHLHINTAFVESDLDCTLPLRKLMKFEQSGEIGLSARSHYSFMGYILQPEILLKQSVPAMIRSMKAEEVDIALLVPF